jgi:lipid A 3-O-deacylase
VFGLVHEYIPATKHPFIILVFFLKVFNDKVPGFKKFLTIFHLFEMVSTKRWGLKGLFLLLAMGAFLYAAEKPTLVTIGCGKWDCNKDPGYCLQAEYRFSFGKLFGQFDLLRPQVVLMVPKCHTVFTGFGIGLEMKPFKYIVVTPSFTPGLYFKGKGQELGYLLEFRSCIEFAFEWNDFRLGYQACHLSNASLGKRNPGANSFLIVLAIPIK